MEEQNTTNTTEHRKSHPWAEAELRRVSRVFELLIQIDQRQKKESNNNKRKHKGTVNPKTSMIKEEEASIG